MSDRSLQICVGLSLAIHLLASLGFSGERWETTVVRPPAAAPPVRVRLAGPPSEPARTERARPNVSAAPPRAEPVPSRPKAVVPEPDREPDPQPAPLPTPALEAIVAAPAPETPPTELAALDAQPLASDEAIDGGSPSSTAPDRLPGESTAEEDEEDRLARYVEAIRSRVQDRKHYPPLARKRAVEGRVVARVAIHADGSLTAVEFDGKAPPLLRRATEDAIRSAAPYPAPPAGAMTIELPVEYSLRDAS